MKNINDIYNYVNECKDLELNSVVSSNEELDIPQRIKEKYHTNYIKSIQNENNFMLCAIGTSDIIIYIKDSKKKYYLVKIYKKNL